MSEAPLVRLAATHLGRTWWTFVLRGVLAILFGVASFISPGITLVVLVAFFGAWTFVDGVLTLIAALRTRATNPRWWALLLIGLAGIAVGVIAFVAPIATLVALQWTAALWAILIGALAVLAAVKLREVIDGEWALALSGLLSVAFGVVVVLYPVASAIAMIWLLSAYAVVLGILLVILGLRLKGRADEVVPRG